MDHPAVCEARERLTEYLRTDAPGYWGESVVPKLEGAVLLQSYTGTPLAGLDALIAEAFPIDPTVLQEPDKRKRHVALAKAMIEKTGEESDLGKRATIMLRAADFVALVDSGMSSAADGTKEGLASRMSECLDVFGGNNELPEPLERYVREKLNDGLEQSGWGDSRSKIKFATAVLFSGRTVDNIPLRQRAVLQIAALSSLEADPLGDKEQDYCFALLSAAGQTDLPADAGEKVNEALLDAVKKCDKESPLLANLAACSEELYPEAALEARLKALDGMLDICGKGSEIEYFLPRIGVPPEGESTLWTPERRARLAGLKEGVDGYNAKWTQASANEEATRIYEELGSQGDPRRRLVLRRLLELAGGELGMPRAGSPAPAPASGGGGNDFMHVL